MQLRSIILGLLLLATGISARAADIVLEPKTAKIEGVADRASREGKPLIGSWSSTNMIARWQVDVPQKASYRAFVTLSSPPASAGSTLEIRIANQRATCVIPDTGDWNRYQELDLGPVLLRKTGPTELAAQIIIKARGDAMNLKRIRLVPEP